MNKVFLYGAGGHATSVIDALKAAGESPVLIIDDDPKKKGQQIANIKIGSLADLRAEEISDGSFVVAIAKNDIRKRVAEEMRVRGAKLCGVRHPSSVISPLAFIDPTAQILAGAIVNAGAVVKAHAVLNTGCIIEHDTTVGEFVHVAPGAVVAGAAVLEEGAFVATGAKVCPFVRIGSWSTLGAGAVALRDIAPNCVAVGVPARIKAQGVQR